MDVSLQSSIEVQGYARAEGLDKPRAVMTTQGKIIHENDLKLRGKNKRSSEAELMLINHTNPSKNGIS